MRSAPTFRHVCSLSLGITTRRADLGGGGYWNDYMAILSSLRRRGVWFGCGCGMSCFSSCGRRRGREIFEKVILVLSSSINELGLDECHFSRYEEMISFVRAFLRCGELYVQNCVTGGQDSPKNSSAGSPHHKLFIVDLLVDLSRFVEGAELDVYLLDKLVRDLRSVKGIRRVISATPKSPAYSGIAVFLKLRRRVLGRVGYSTRFLPITTKAFVTSASSGWHLESPTTGPMYHESGCSVLRSYTQGLPQTPLT